VQGIARVGAATGPLLLADISGYTHFLADVADAHRDDAFAGGKVPDAYALVSSLLDGIITSLVPPYALAKLEGDAVFVYATATDELPHGHDVLDAFAACYEGFRAQLASAKSIWPCRCDACERVEALDLKFILHAGPFVIQPMGGSTELVGAEVVMAHRLLKNRASELVGAVPYALITSAAAEMLDVPTHHGLELVEQYERLPPVMARVVALQ
jgi:hypothetical protein